MPAKKPAKRGRPKLNKKGFRKITVEISAGSHAILEAQKKRTRAPFGGTIDVALLRCKEYFEI